MLGIISASSQTDIGSILEYLLRGGSFERRVLLGHVVESLPLLDLLDSHANMVFSSCLSRL